MNKKILALATAVVVSIFGNSTVFAANLPKVVFNANKQFVYEGNIKKIGNSVTLLGDEFEGIAPGDTRTQVIELEGPWAHRASHPRGDTDNDQIIAMQ